MTVLCSPSRKRQQPQPGHHQYLPVPEDGPEPPRKSAQSPDQKKQGAEPVLSPDPLFPYDKNHEKYLFALQDPPVYSFLPGDRRGNKKTVHYTETEADSGYNIR